MAFLAELSHSLLGVPPVMQRGMNRMKLPVHRMPVLEVFQVVQRFLAVEQADITRLRRS